MSCTMYIKMRYHYYYYFYYYYYISLPASIEEILTAYYVKLIIVHQFSTDGYAVIS